jgi:hypothetical protein
MRPIHFCRFEHTVLHVGLRAPWRVCKFASPSIFCVLPIPDFCALSRRSRQNGGRLRSNQQLTSMSELTLLTEHEVGHRESDANDHPFRTCGR